MSYSKEHHKISAESPMFENDSKVFIEKVNAMLCNGLLPDISKHWLEINDLTLRDMFCDELLSKSSEDLYIGVNIPSLVEKVTILKIYRETGEGGFW